MAADLTKRAQLLRLRAGTALGGLVADLDLSAATDPDDEETMGLVSTDSFLAAIGQKDRGRLRKIVKAVHLRNYPTELITDREADRVIEVMGPITREKLIRKAVEHGMFS